MTQSPKWLDPLSVCVCLSLSLSLSLTLSLLLSLCVCVCVCDACVPLQMITMSTTGLNFSNISSSVAHWNNLTCTSLLSTSSGELRKEVYLSLPSHSPPSFSHFPCCFPSLFLLIPLSTYCLSLFPPSLCSVVPGVFGVQLTACLELVKQMLVKALQASQKEVGYELFISMTTTGCGVRNISHR